MCVCLSYEHDGKDSAVSSITGHHPSCPNFKIDKNLFFDNLQIQIERANQITANRIISEELPKITEKLKPKIKVKKEFTEALIQTKLFSWRNKQGHYLIVPNVKTAYGEADLISVTKADRVIEHEIKISRADYKHDFTKELKHFNFDKYLTKPGWGKSGNACIPNYFNYVVPKDLIKLEEVPAYAGLIYFDRDCEYTSDEIKVIKKAPLLHKDTIHRNMVAKLRESIYWRFWYSRIGVNSETQEVFDAEFAFFKERLLETVLNDDREISIEWMPEKSGLDAIAEWEDREIVKVQMNKENLGKEQKGLFD